MCRAFNREFEIPLKLTGCSIRIVYINMTAALAFHLLHLIIVLKNNYKVNYIIIMQVTVYIDCTEKFFFLW